MKVFTQKFNPLSGKNEWIMQEENYDYHQEVARSSYADMLHDKERNQKYFDALKKAISTMKREGKRVKVLDIGTGSGLLSMMAMHAGADYVIACEAFEPVAKCALQVIKDNGYEGKIRVIPKRSTELTVGVDGDMQERANLLVTEVFDTELIGEGALSTFRHALTYLLEPNSVVIPSSATVYAQVVESSLLSNFNKLRPIPIAGESAIEPPTKVAHCSGAAAVHDIQMAQLTSDMFLPLSTPIAVFQFDFTGKKPLKLKSHCVDEISVLNDGQGEIVFMWWDLKMDFAGEIILSCAPSWSHPEPEEMQWRDHWMQAIYYLPEEQMVSKGDTVYLASYHDEYSLWFRMCKTSIEANEFFPSPVCSCLMHCGNSRSRLGMINDPTKNSKYIKILKKHITPNSVCLCLGDGSLLPLIAAKLGAKKVFAVEPQFLHCNTLKSYIEHNKMESTVHLINKCFENLSSADLEDQVVDLMISEPYFTTSLLPWHSLYFWYLRDLLSPLLSKSVTIVPHQVILQAVALEFDDLWKIRAPVGEAEGFDISTFDHMIQKAISLSDAPVEPHPLWEYRSKALTNSFELLTFDLSADISSKLYEKSGFINFLSSGTCNGVALWVDFNTNDTVITTGPTAPICSGKPVAWDMYSRQGVYFIHPYKVVKSDAQKLSYNVSFNANTGEFNFSFSVHSNK